MSRKSLQHLECAVANTVEMVNDSWTILILRDAFLGVRRFDEFVNDLGIARNVLTDRLERLVGNGMLETRLYQDRPPRYEYRLTEQGKDLFDVLMTLWSYGERWKPPAGSERQRVVHVSCGKRGTGRDPLRSLRGEAHPEGCPDRAAPAGRPGPTHEVTAAAT